MTRQECEAKIVEKLREIWDIAQEYSPKEKRILSMAVDGEHASCFRIVGGKRNCNEYDINVFEWKGV